MLDKGGNIVWYCPKRFESPSFFAALLDAKAGAWTIEIEGLEFDKRSYLGDSALLQTYFKSEYCSLLLEDWMPLDASFFGTSKQIREYVEENCLTSDGNYAVYVGSENVDVSTALFPIRGFKEADSPQMLKTKEAQNEIIARITCTAATWKNLTPKKKAPF